MVVNHRNLADLAGRPAPGSDTGAAAQRLAIVAVAPAGAGARHAAVCAWPRRRPALGLPGCRSGGVRVDAARPPAIATQRAAIGNTAPQEASLLVSAGPGDADAGDRQRRFAQVLRAERRRRAGPADLKELAAFDTAPGAFAPARPRDGWLFGRVPAQDGRISAPTACDLLMPDAGKDSGGATPPPSTGSKRPRWVPELCGGPLHRANLATDAGRARALQALQAREPIVLESAWEVLPGARSWSVERLREHLAGALKPCHVLKAKREKQKYTYYFQNLADREMPLEAKKAVPCNEALDVPFERFLRLARDDPAHSYYCQTSLFAIDPSKGPTAPAYVTSQSLKDDLDKARNGLLWREISEAMHHPDWFRSQLFVGPVGTLGSAHFDQYDNMFLQVRGTKRILLFDPRSAARGLYPFPVHHPYDQRARVDLEAPNYAAFPRLAELRGAGVEAVLRPGEAIFIPAHWWHHVESTAATPWCVSVNFWLDYVNRHLLVPPSPLGPELEVELARQIEYLAADAFGPEAVHSFLSSLTSEVVEEGKGRGPLEEEEHHSQDIQRVAAQNYVLRHLALIFGPEAVKGFVEDFLCPQRWEDLQPVCF